MMAYDPGLYDPKIPMLHRDRIRDRTSHARQFWEPSHVNASRTIPPLQNPSIGRTLHPRAEHFLCNCGIAHRKLTCNPCPWMRYRFSEELSESILVAHQIDPFARRIPDIDMESTQFLNRFRKQAIDLWSD
jgi:hypothetical protein